MTKLTIHTKIQLGEKVIAEGNQEEVYQIIMGIIVALPKECQNPFYLTTIHGLSDQEVGEYLNCSAEKVRDHMNCALSFIRKNVNELQSEFKKSDTNGFYKSIRNLKKNG